MFQFLYKYETISKIFDFGIIRENYFKKRFSEYFLE